MTLQVALAFWASAVELGAFPVGHSRVLKEGVISLPQLHSTNKSLIVCTLCCVLKYFNWLYCMQD